MTAADTNRSLLGEICAEFLGTLVLIALGDGVVAMVTLFDSAVIRPFLPSPQPAST